jgi:hypothetical protein
MKLVIGVLVIGSPNMRWTNCVLLSQCERHETSEPKHELDCVLLAQCERHETSEPTQGSVI